MSDDNAEQVHQVRLHYNTAGNFPSNQRRWNDCNIMRGNYSSFSHPSRTLPSLRSRSFLNTTQRSGRALWVSQLGLAKLQPTSCLVQYWC